MAFGETKVYFDGSHYIAIPYEPNPRANYRKKKEPLITVKEEGSESEESINARGGENDIESEPDDQASDNAACWIELDRDIDEALSESDNEKSVDKTLRQITKKEFFNELYDSTRDMSKRSRRSFIVGKMQPYFKSKEEAKTYVNTQFERKLRNLIVRRTRLVRKINLQEFNYFCTFTYDDKKHTEESFKTKLRDCFKKMCSRRKWKFAGVWERSNVKKRLHFHGLFYIPEGSMVGELVKSSDYSVKKKKVQNTVQNTYFNERFGRSDFREIEDKSMMGEAIAYIVKYIEKTGEKIVYSKGFPQYFISDILDDDVVCRIGLEDKKLLLFDNFSCFDNGVYMGEVSKETIAKMRKANN